VTTFTLEAIDEPPLQCGRALSEMCTLSPYVWREESNFYLLLRAVNHSEDPEDKVSRIYAGESADNLRFTMSDHPVVKPGPGEDDRDGCEDPTVAVVNDALHVYYGTW